MLSDTKLKELCKDQDENCIKANLIAGGFIKALKKIDGKVIDQVNYDSQTNWLFLKCLPKKRVDYDSLRELISKSVKMKLDAKKDLYHHMTINKDYHIYNISVLDLLSSEIINKIERSTPQKFYLRYDGDKNVIFNDSKMVVDLNENNK